MPVPAKKNTAFIYYSALVQQADTRLLKSSPTLAAGDFKTSLDGGALGNLGTLPTVTPAASVMVKYTLATTETNGDNFTVVSIDAAGAEWCDRCENFQTSVRQLDDLAFPNTSGRGQVIDANGLADATVVKFGPSGSGTAVTARDIGASVLLSAGTGTGQLDFTSGIVKADLTQILATTLTETAGLLAGGFKKFFNVATPTGTLNSIPDAVPGAAGGLFIAGTNAATVVTGSFTTTFTGNLTGSAGSVTGAVGSVTGAVGSVTGNVGGNVVGTVALVLGNVAGNVVGSVGSVLAGVTVTTNNDKTGYALTASYDFAKGTTAMTESYSVKGATVTPVQALYEVLQMMQEMVIAGTTMTIKKRDQATTSMTFTLDSATDPAAVTRAT